MKRKRPPRLSRPLRFARLDLERLSRRRFPEVIYAPGKSVEQIAAIARTLRRNRQPVFVTKVSPRSARWLLAHCPWLVHFLEAGILASPPTSGRPRRRLRKGVVWVVTAGTADIPVAQEAAVTLRWMGVRVRTLFDVGVAGLHRLVRHLPSMRRARVIVVVAGMDGVLPSVVSGLVPSPVVAVPTRTGYGASFRGVGPLLTMLNACSPGVGVVNIDNGFGAGYLAGLIAS